MVDTTEAIEEYKLREVYTRWLQERMGDIKAAEFSRQTRISKAELSVIKDGTRKVTEGQIIKVCASVGPQLSEALARMALIARDVEREIQDSGGHVTLEAADEAKATLVTPGGKKVIVRRDAADAAVRRIEAETGAPTEPKKKGRRQKHSRPSSAQVPSAPAAPQRHPSQRS